MYTLFKLIHLGAAIVWLGGMTFTLLILRPALGVLAQGPDRLRLLLGVLDRFFRVVWFCIAALAASGVSLLVRADASAAPLGWHLMAGAGTLMFLIFGHLYFAPYRRLKRHVAASAWALAAPQAAQIARGVLANCVLGWLAVAAVVLWS